MNKLSKFCNELSNHTDIKPEIYLSPATGYRARAEFGFQ
jgi:tRNA/tmRNA/rRNA uracil-C5-methylase (TrmA/RlmC/RlmD family)